MKIDAVDLRGSWADDFEKFVLEKEEELAAKSRIKLIWGDVEQEEIWSQLQTKEKYDYIIGHYLLDFIGDINTFINRVASGLKEGGLFSVNGFEVSSEHVFWKQLFDEMELKTAFIDVKLQAEVRQTECFKELSNLSRSVLNASSS